MCCQASSDLSLFHLKSGGHNTFSLGNIPEGHRTGCGGGEQLRDLHGLRCQELVSWNLIPTHVDTTLRSLGEVSRQRGFRACPSDLTVLTRDAVILSLQMTKFASPNALPGSFTEDRGPLSRLLSVSEVQNMPKNIALVKDSSWSFTF